MNKEKKSDVCMLSWIEAQMHWQRWCSRNKIIFETLELLKCIFLCHLLPISLNADGSLASLIYVPYLFLIVRCVRASAGKIDRTASAMCAAARYPINYVQFTFYAINTQEPFYATNTTHIIIYDALLFAAAAAASHCLSLLRANEHME